MIKGYIRSLRIVHFSLAAGIMLFMTIALFLNVNNGALLGNSVPITEKTTFIVVLIVLTGGILIAYRIVIGKKLTLIKSLDSLEAKLMAWREIIVLRAALIEGPAFMAIVFFMLLGLHVLLLWPLVALVAFWLQQPTRDLFCDEANLTANEIAEINK